MVPDDLQRHAYRRSGLTRVQQWVLSTLAVTTIMHLVLGLSVAAGTMDVPETSSRIGLLVVSGLLGMGAVAVGLAIHRTPLPHWSLLLGALPAAIGAFIVL